MEELWEAFSGKGSSKEDTGMAHIQEWHTLKEQDTSGQQKGGDASRCEVYRR